MIHIVITGGFGFLGSHTVERCSDLGFIPIVLERQSSRTEKLANKDFIAIPYDNIDDPNLVQSIKSYNPQYFIHIGWKGVDNSTRNLEDQIGINLPFTLKTVELAKQTGCKKWIGIGSLSEYGITTSIVSEEFAPFPYTIYGKSKLASCWASSALCQAYKLKWSWIRVGSIYGPGDSDQWLIPFVIKALLSGESPKLTPSEQVWDYLHVSDAANAILHVAKSDAEGIFNLGSGSGKTIKTIVSHIASKINSGAAPLFGALPYAKHQVMHMEADISRIQKITGWKPKIDLSDGLESTISEIKAKI